MAPPPLTGIRVLEFAGLAPGPFTGLLLSDYGASVLRLDRSHNPNNNAHNGAITTTTTTPPPRPSPDKLTRRKTSIAVDLKNPKCRALLLSLIPHADVLIDPFRPGVLERLGLDPRTVLLRRNPRLIVARLTGFRREGRYRDMAGHDINYLAVSGVLSMLGPPAAGGGLPLAPGNILADFAGGGTMCFMGVVLALLARERTGRGQIVEANMVDGVSYLATMPRLAMKSPTWNRPRGENVLDGGCPYYGTYATKDGKAMAVGALEPQFFVALLDGLGLREADVVEKGTGGREDRRNWPMMKKVFAVRFRSRTRREWEDVFDGTDACVTPVLDMAELERQGYEQRVAVGLTDTPGLAFGSGDSGWTGGGLGAGVGGEETLRDWCGWEKGREYYQVDNGALLWMDHKARL